MMTIDKGKERHSLQTDLQQEKRKEEEKVIDR